MEMWSPTSKRSSRAEERNLSRKLGEDQKKVFTVCSQGENQQGHKIIIAGIAIEGEGPVPPG